MANDEVAVAAPPAALAESAAPARPAAGALPQLRYLLRSMRPRQWTKNGIVFLALIFSVGQEYHLSDTSTWVPKLLESLVAFACFAMVSSADYLVNDIRDIERRPCAPEEAKRPIAAGLLPVRTAWIAAVVLAVVGNAGAFALNWRRRARRPGVHRR